MEKQFREIGLKLKLVAGKWYLLEDFVVAKKDEKLTPEQVRMLKQLDLRIDEFKIKITSHNNKTGEYTCIDSVGFSTYSKNKKDQDFEVVDDDDDLVIS